MKKATLSFAIAAIVLTGSALGLNSCSKSSGSTTTTTTTNDAAQYVGSYTFSSPCWGTFTAVGAITATSNTTINLPLVLQGNTTCAKTIAFPATVSGNTVEPTSVSATDACNNPWTVSCYGSINGSTITLYYTFTNSSGSANCTFTGTK